MHDSLSVLTVVSQRLSTRHFKLNLDKAEPLFFPEKANPNPNFNPSMTSSISTSPGVHATRNPWVRGTLDDQPSVAASVAAPSHC